MGLGARWPEIGRCYREVNDLFGDIVKVTPSSKVVGDMALLLFTRGIKAAANDPLQIGAAIPGMITAMNGTVAEVLAGIGEAVGAGDLMIRLR